jgi:hypothetical protein
MLKDCEQCRNFDKCYKLDLASGHVSKIPFLETIRNRDLCLANEKRNFKRRGKDGINDKRN